MNVCRCVVVWIIVAGTVAAQPPKAEPKPAQPTDLQVVQLKNANAVDVGRVLQELFATNARAASVRVVAEPTTNSILVAAAADDTARIREVIAKLDVAPPAGNATDAPQVRVYPLKHVPADKAVLDALRLFIGNNSLAVDARQNQVVVSAADGVQKNIAALLARLDVAAEVKPVVGLQVRVVWLAAGAENGPTPPDDLKDVVDALKKIGVDKIRLRAQTLINVTPGAEFQAKGKALYGAPFSVVGRVTEKGGTPSLTVTVRATELSPAPAAGGGPGAPGMPGGATPADVTTIQTDIAAPLGHLTVLGMTPADTTTSVFVVQIVRTESKPAR